MSSQTPSRFFRSSQPGASHYAYSAGLKIQRNEARSSRNTVTPSDEIREVAKKALELKGEYEGAEDCPADSTFHNFFEVIESFDNARQRASNGVVLGLPLPDIDVSSDGCIDMEWISGDRQFSISVTDTKQLVYAYYFDKSNRGSGYVDKSNAFTDVVLAAISNVYLARTIDGEGA